jgi:hypothetical protein
MKMEFTYEDFLNNFYGTSLLIPTTPLEPHRCIDRGRFPVSEEAISKRIETTKNALEQRMGGEYFSKYDRARTLSLGYANTVFPAYSMLYLDIACEDWLSLVDFHKGFGRDHSVHQPLTAYIVSKLLGGGKENAGFEICGETLMKKALDAINDTGCQYLRDRLAFYDSASPLLQGDRDLLRIVFYQTAIITAMYHDLGYPWQFIERMHDFLKDDILLCGRLKYDEEGAVNPIVSNYIVAHNNELMFRPFYDYGKGGLTTAHINEKVFEKYLHESHGLPGALAYWAYNAEYHTGAGERTAGLIKFCQEWTSLAILMHDMQKAYDKHGFARLDFKSDPLSFIIALADTLEDFNRPNATINADGTGMGCQITYSFPSLSVELIENGGVGMLKFAVVEKERANQEKYKRNDQRNLFDEGGYFDLASVGLTSMTIDIM